MQSMGFLKGPATGLFVLFCYYFVTKTLALLQSMIHRLYSLDYYIRTKSTGTPRQLANKLNICERQAREYINLFRELGAPVKYDRTRSTYYYEFEGVFNFKFSKLRNT